MAFALGMAPTGPACSYAGVGTAELPGLGPAVTLGTGQARARTMDAFAKKAGSMS